MNWNEVVRLPLPPSANRLVRPAKMGEAMRLVKTQDAREWAQTARAILATHASAHGLRPLACAVRLEVVFHFRELTSDLSNRIKQLEDAMTGIVWNDDRQVGECWSRKSFARHGVAPYVEVKVQPWPGDGQLDQRLQRAAHEAELKAAREARNPKPKPPAAPKVKGRTGASDESIAQRLARMATPAVYRSGGR